MRKTLAALLVICGSLFLWASGVTAQDISQVENVAVDAPADGGPITVSWEEVEGAEGYVVTVLVLNFVGDTEFRRFVVTEQVGAQTEVVISSVVPGPNIAIVQAVIAGTVGPESEFAEFTHPHTAPRILGAVRTGTTTTLQFQPQAILPAHVTNAMGRRSVRAEAVVRPINGTPGTEQTAFSFVGDVRGANIGPIWMVPLGPLPDGEYEVDLTVADSLPSRLQFTVGDLPVEPIRVRGCRATVSLNSTLVTITGDLRADSYVIYREVDGRPEAWRGRIEGTESEFVDWGFTHGGFVKYRVAIRNEDGTMNPKSNCFRQNSTQLRSPCAANVGPSSVGVKWVTLDSATEYLIYRSVNGGPFFWRGRHSVNATASDPAIQTFADVSAGTTAEYLYRVVGITTNDVLTGPIHCNPQTPVDPVASCAVVFDNGIATVSWQPVQLTDVLHENVEYIVRRSVDGSPMHWRGRTADASFEDVLRGANVDYDVQPITSDYRLGNSPTTRCTTG